MRLLAPVVVSVLCAIVAADSKRYGVEADAKTYPQATPKDTLASALKAIQNKRVDYLVAQLADPAYVDERVKRVFGGKFDEQVTYTQTKLDAAAVKLLERFLQDGTWTARDETATVRLKDLKDRAVNFVKVGDRWYIQNDDKHD